MAPKAENGSAEPTPDEPKHGVLHYAKEFIKNITVEPVLACWILPSLFLFVAMENLGLEKSCRVNLALDDMTCVNMINRSINNIDCSTFEADAPANTEMPVGIRKLDNIDDIDFEMNMNDTSDVFVGSRFGGDYDEPPTTIDTDFNDTDWDPKWDYLKGDDLPSDRVVTGEELKELTARVCKAEVDSQKLISVINGYRAPIAQIFPIIIILFAGGWSDKKEIRKPCMLFPLIGELLGCTALFISAIFMRQLPMEFGSILEKVLPAMFGGQTLMIMGFYSYMTATTKEEDRTFRFTCFAIFFTIITIVGIPFSGDLYNILGYTKLFLFCIVVYLIGILYIIFVLKEVKKKHKPKEVEKVDGQENPAYDADNTEMTDVSRRSTAKMEENGNEVVKKVEEEKKNFFVEFFDPTLAIACITVFIKQRPNNGRTILFLLAACYFIFIAPAFGEGDYLYIYTRIKLNWDGVDYSHYATYNSLMGLVGTALLTGIMSKFLKISDPLIGMISSLCSTIAKPMFALATATVTFYIATTIDMFIGTRPIAMKSIISKFVEVDELGRVYSILGILDAFAGFIMPSIYSAVYINTVDFFPGAFYIFGDFFMIASFIIFLIIYIIFKRHPLKSAEENAENGMTDIDLQENPEPKEKYKKMEVTHM